MISKLASSLGRNDEQPNIELAQEIAASNDITAVRELIDHLKDKNKAIQHDCIKVLYEIGDRQPELIADYVQTFIQCLHSKDNRMVWGAMTALGTIVNLKANEIWDHIDIITTATEKGSVITQDWGVRVLAEVAAKSSTYEARIFPFLIDFLKSCRPKDLPRHAESVAVAVNKENVEVFIALLASRKPVLKPAQQKRIEKLIKQVNAWK